MKNMLSSNEIVADFFYDEVNKDYSFFRVETSEKYIAGGAAFLDLDSFSYVRAVSFERGKSFYVMTSSSAVSRSGITRALNEYEGGDSLSVLQVKAENIRPNILLQLFLNSISNPTDEICSYNNLSGKLLCYKPAWLDRDKDGVLWGLNCLEIRICEDMCLNMSVHKMTSLRLQKRMKFEKRKIYEYPQYEFSYNNHTLRRVGGDKINDKNNLIQKPIEGDRGNEPFFDFSNYEAFSCTKVGILYEMMNLVKEQFKRYLSISLKEYDIQETLAYNRKELEQYKATVAEQLRATEINIVDEVKSTSSESYLQDVCEVIKDIIPELKCSVGKRLSKGKVNIRYIHDKEFYTEKDPHAEKLGEYVVQHITVENFNYKTKAAVSNVLKELVIKNDLKAGKLSIVDWGKYLYSSDWIFGTVIDKEYYFMIIHPNGSFDIQKMQRDLLNMTEYDSYMDFFNVDADYSSGNYAGVVGLIKDSEGNVNLIKDTNMYTIPDYNQIGDILKNVADKAVFNGKELFALLQNARNGSEDAKVIEELDSVISDIDPSSEYDKTAIMGMLKGMNTKKAVVKRVFEDTGVMLYAYLRNEEAREEFMSGSLDINYYGISDKLARFCVGEIGSGMKYSMERASVIREVEAVEDSSLVFKELLPLMGVEFVRYGMLTVMPFPFKYLREYASGLNSN